MAAWKRFFFDWGAPDETTGTSGGWPTFHRPRRSFAQVERERSELIHRQRIDLGILPGEARQAVVEAAPATLPLANSTTNLEAERAAQQRWEASLRAIYQAVAAEEMRALWELEVERQRLLIEEQELAVVFLLAA